MIWVIKVTEAAGQHRITLPKAFCKDHKIGESDYLVINDNEPDRMTIGRFMYGKAEERKD